MKKLYSYVPTIFLFCSCSTTLNYLGNNYDPTQKVDVFVDESAVKRSYDIVGKGYVKSTMFTKPEHVQFKAIQTAKKKGADAVLIKDYYLPFPKSSIQTTLLSDSLGKSLITIGNSSVRPDLSSEFIVFFLKYNK
jgi:hypothetical protein